MTTLREICLTVKYNDEELCLTILDSKQIRAVQKLVDRIDEVLALVGPEPEKDKVD